MQPPPPLLVSQRRRIWGATDARDAPRRASLPTHAAAGEGPSGSPAAEDPVLLGVSDGYMPLKGVIQVERPGQTDAQSKLVNFIIRPPRTDYSPNDDLWEQEFMVKGRWFQRKDLEVIEAGSVLNNAIRMQGINRKSARLMRRRDMPGGRPVRGVAAVVLVPHAQRRRETICLEIEYRI